MPKFLLYHLLGLIFIVSGLSKAINIPAFSIETALFIDAYFPQFLIQWKDWVAIAVCTTELFIGIIICNNRVYHISRFLLLLCLSFFTCLITLNLFFPPDGGCIESCGCFGELIHFSPLSSFYKNIILLVISIYLFFRYRPICIPRKKRDSAIFHLGILSSIAAPLSLFLFLGHLTKESYLFLFIFFTIIISISAFWPSIKYFHMKLLASFLLLSTFYFIFMLYRIKERRI